MQAFTLTMKVKSVKAGEYTAPPSEQKEHHYHIILHLLCVIIRDYLILVGQGGPAESRGGGSRE